MGTYSYFSFLTGRLLRGGSLTKALRYVTATRVCMNVFVFVRTYFNIFKNMPILTFFAKSTAQSEQP